jgi:hypothetical protein
MDATDTVVRIHEDQVPRPPREEPAVVHDADDVDYDALAPKQLTASILNAYIEEHPEAGYPEFPFYCAKTSMRLGKPFTAQVRLINLADRAVVGTLAPNVRKLVMKLFFSGSGQTSNQRKQGNTEVQAETTMKRVKEVAYAYGCAGFLSPRLVLERGDVRDPEKEAWVGSLDLGDLQEFLRICEGDDVLAARRLDGFSFGQD